LLYVTARGLELDKVIRDLARCKNAILRCITRKKHRGQAVAYFVYARIALGVSDEVRRSIARFYSIVELS
jgi:hypothetical protein